MMPAVPEVKRPMLCFYSTSVIVLTALYCNCWFRCLAPPDPDLLIRTFFSQHVVLYLAQSRSSEDIWRIND